MLLIASWKVVHCPQSCNPAVGDLGSASEVPSIRDDQSVSSAPSEICVSFPASISENGCEWSMYAQPATGHRNHLIGNRQ